MRFLFGVLVGYNLRGKNKPLITVLAIVLMIDYVIVPAGALLALGLDVQRERQSRPVQTKVPTIKGLSYEEAETKLHASNLNIRLVGDTLRSSDSAWTDYRPSSPTWRGSRLRLLGWRYHH
jgi:hypothetical protein